MENSSLYWYIPHFTYKCSWMNWDKLSNPFFNCFDEIELKCHILIKIIVNIVVVLRRIISVRLPGPWGIWHEISIPAIKIFHSEGQI